MEIQKLVQELTVEEKAALVSGTDFMFTNPIPRLGIPSVCMADGPHGLRKQKGELDNGIAQSEPATAFPAAVTTASGWNPENTRRMGEAIAEECLHYGVHILLGPGVNIKRNPLCGRNFEYFSEDPLLAGKMGAAEVQGVQSKGVGVSVKHFALNNSENYRFMGDSIADMRAIREIYLKAFEYVVNEAKPYTMMCAYNKINGTFCSENRWLLTEVLRKEWGFDGAVMTDWGAIRNRVEGLKAGLDLEMPGDTAICRKWILDGVKAGDLKMEDLNKAAENILKLVEKCIPQEKKATNGNVTDKKAANENEKVDWAVHHKLAAEIAEDCAVLLKNDGILPLKPGRKLLVAGDLFDKMRYQGAGSSMICPTEVTTARNAFDTRNISYEFVRGYEENKIEPQQELIAEAVSRAADHDEILIFAGLTDYVESEGGDRENMKLPQNQLALIDALQKTGKKLIVVLYGGSVMELPFADGVSGILNMFLPGQNGGTATAALLFGDRSPSGKLAETWVRTYEDVPFGEDYGKSINEVYKESIFVGYRYYLTAKNPVRYPFGYGLSYTTFSYEDMQVTRQNEKITVSCEISNTGSCDGAEIVQLYVKAPRSDVVKPEKELRAFTKVYLKTGESKRAEMTFDEKDLRYYHPQEERWVSESGSYELQICSDCMTVRLSSSLEIEGEDNMYSPYSMETGRIYGHADMEAVTDSVFEKMSERKIPVLPASLPIHPESRFTDLKQTFMGRILYRAVLGVAGKQMKEAKKLLDGTEKDNKIKGALFMKRILESNSIRTMSMSGGKNMPYNFAQGFVELSNGHLLRGARCFLSSIKVPPLPKEQK